MKSPFTLYSITFFLILFLIQDCLGAPNNYILDWDKSPFLTESSGPYHWATYATGPKNMVFYYNENQYESGYPQVQSTNNGSIEDRVILKTASNSDAEFEFQFQDLQVANADYADGILFRIHDIDQENVVTIHGIDPNGVAINPAVFVIDNFSYTIGTSPGGNPQISGNGNSASGLKGSVKVLFTQKVKKVVIHLSDGDPLISDRQVVVDDIYVDATLAYQPQGNIKSFAWEYNYYPPGSLAQSYSVNNNNPAGVNVTWSGTTWDFYNNYPQNNSQLGNFDLNGYNLSHVTKSLPGGNDLTVTFELDKGYDDVHFSIGDIDNFIPLSPTIDVVSDDVEVVGEYNGYAVFPYAYSTEGGSSFRFVNQGGASTSVVNQDMVDATSVTRGTMNIIFPSKVDKFYIYFKNVYPSVYHAPLEMGISAIHLREPEPEPIEISGNVFLDSNQDSYWDQNEKGFEGMEVTLYRDENLDGIPEQAVDATYTGNGIIDLDNDGIPEPPGYYSFEVIESGGYIVQCDPGGSGSYFQTADPDGVLDDETAINIGSSASYYIKHFGYASEERRNKENRRSVGISDKVNIYPNPCHTSLNIPNATIRGLQGYNLYNISGTLIKSAKGEQTGDIIDTADLINGKYFIQLFFPEGTESFKFTKF